jgi:hypothetical protein
MSLGRIRWVAWRVGNPDRTHFSVNVRFGGYPPGILDCGFEALKERIGDLP